MALQVQESKKRFPWVRVLILLVLFGLLCLTGWFTYRWYMYGDKFPVEVPVLATADSRVDESEVTVDLVAEHKVGPSDPRYIMIPSLGIGKTRVFGMGVKDNGALADPVNISDVAWYNAGSATPGSGGVILMNGHNGGITRNGVFAQLGTLQKGDIIEVERGDGKVFKYEVQENQSMPLEEVNDTGMKMMMESAVPGKEALNLITCDGKWVPRLQLFDRRIMLRSTLVGEEDA